MNVAAGSAGGLGEIATISWRKPSPGGGPPIAPVRGGPTGKVRVKTTPMRLNIDSSQGRREAGYHTITGLAKAGWRHTAKVARKGVARIVSDGNTLAAIENGGNAIANLAFQRMLKDLRDTQFTIAFLPKTPPKINFTPGRISIDVVY